MKCFECGSTNTYFNRIWCTCGDCHTSLETELPAVYEWAPRMLSVLQSLRKNLQEGKAIIPGSDLDRDITIIIAQAGSEV